MVLVLGDLSARARLVSASSAGYPIGFLDLPDAPSVFRVLGDLPVLDRAISIVGTRRADDEALDFAYSLEQPDRGRRFGGSWAHLRCDLEPGARWRLGDTRQAPRAASTRNLASCGVDSVQNKVNETVTDQVYPVS
jgi:hypothetical protein